MLVDWSGSAFTIKGRAPDPQAYNLSLYTVVAAAAPFHQTDWSSTKFPAPRAPDQQAYNLALLNIAIVGSPFYQNNWPTQFSRLGMPDASRQTNINLFNNPVPFALYDWSKTAFAVPVRPDASLALNPNLYPETPPPPPSPELHDKPFFANVGKLMGN
jgi:hypothetical protein